MLGGLEVESYLILTNFSLEYLVVRFRSNLKVRLFINVF